MKRVLLLVFLMVSLVELDLERYRIYLFCSTAAVAGLLCNILMSRRKARNAPEAQALESAHRDSGLSGERSSEVANVAHSNPLEDTSQNVGSARGSLREVGPVHNRSTHNRNR